MTGLDRVVPERAAKVRVLDVDVRLGAGQVVHPPMTVPRDVRPGKNLSPRSDLSIMARAIRPVPLAHDRRRSWTRRRVRAKPTPTSHVRSGSRSSELPSGSANSRPTPAERVRTGHTRSP